MADLVDFAGNHTLLVLGLIGSWGVVMVYELRLKTQNLTNVSPTDAVRLINKGAMIIDVRSADAFQTGHIVNARHIAFADVASNKAIAKKQKNKMFLTVCDDGSISGKAANVLRNAGYESAFSLKGGLKNWQTENMPLVR
jgi:rhodanese-related sulfurtransferase